MIYEHLLFQKYLSQHKFKECLKKKFKGQKKGEQIDEGILGSIAGGGLGLLAGPAIGKAICSVLGIKEEGPLGKLLTSRLVTTAMGIALGKK